MADKQINAQLVSLTVLRSSTIFENRRCEREQARLTVRHKFELSCRVILTDLQRKCCPKLCAESNDYSFAAAQRLCACLLCDGSQTLQ